MMFRFKDLVILVFIVHISFEIKASTHWLLSNDGKIQPQLTSPYYLKQPNDLVAFLNQNVYKKKLDLIIEELLTIKTNLTQKMNKLDMYTNDLTTKIGCIPNYYLDEADLFNTIVNKNYLNRISFNLDKNVKGTKVVPRCAEFMQVDYSMACFEHLEGMMNRTKLKMEPEEILNSLELSFPGLKNPQMIVDGLKRNSNSWKYYTIASYYWRYKGNAKEAIECARRAILLAPRKSKDIPLLSLGTILQRSNYINDSLIVLNAAVDHEPDEPENQLALGNTFILLSEFNKSFDSYKVAESLNPIYADKIEYIKKSIYCFRDLKINLLTMESLLYEIIPGLERYGVLQKDFEEYHEKLDEEQAPLKTRIFDDKYENQVDFLIQRSQICTTRVTKDKNEPILVCDFISDIQMVMEDFAIEILNNYVDLKKELINTYKINSLGIYKKIFVEFF